MPDQAEFEKGQILVGASVTKTVELLGSYRHKLKTMTDSRSPGKAPATGGISAEFLSLPTETDVHLNALWEKSIGLLPPS